MMSHSEIWKEYMKYLDRQDYTDEELAYACTCDYYSHDSAIMFYAGFRIACKNKGIDFIGIEKDDKYFEIAKKRIEEHLMTASI